MHFRETSICQAPIASWQWFFGDNTSATYTTKQTFVEHTYTIAGTYKVTMVVATQMVGGMITDTSSSNIIVKPAAKADFTWKDVCVGNNSEFENLTQSNNTTVKSYKWNFGVQNPLIDTSTFRNPKFTFGTQGQYNVKLVVTNTLGCTDTIVKKLTIFDLPKADFYWNSSCESKPVLFVDNTDTTTSAIVKWNWIFSKEGEVLGASTTAKSSYTFGHAGIYDADLMVTDRNGCKGSVHNQIAINSSPVAAFEISDNYDNKQGQIMLNNFTTNGTNFIWDFGNGATSTANSPVANFETEGHYKIELITWNGQNCADTLSLFYDLMFKGLYVPNAFSPGHYDEEVAVFKPKGINIRKYLLEIYDRSGNLLWNSSKLDSSGSPAEGWDGTLNGDILKQGVYLWKISAQFRDGKYWEGNSVGNVDGIPQTKSGTITLIR
jgi:PKD repeat protein